MAEELTGYCLKCKEHRVMQGAAAEWAANGAPATRGQCAVCGTNMYKRGHTPAHDALPKPEVSAPPAPKGKSEGKSKSKSKSKSKGKKKGKGKGKASAAGTASSASSNGSDGRRSGRLVVVESPAKAKTISKYLGRGYTVKSSVGHVRDLLKSRLSVDIDNDYEPEYRVPNDKRSVVKDLRDAAAKAAEIYLATDQDREGEAIAWHVLESAEMDPSRTRRVVFNEITRPAILDAFSHPREIDMDRVNAQQARRILDRLVGYKLSPLLWRKVRGRLSAGRVQSVAVRMVVEREREIEAFEAQEYWSLEADVIQHAHARNRARQFRAKFFQYQGEKPELDSAEAVRPHVAALEQATWHVGEVRLGQRKRRPAAPFTTSTLQQEASRKLGFGTSKTMRVAQQLYEGVDVGEEGTIGLITYMRTDSTFISTVAQAEAREFIAETFGSDHMPDEAPQYKTKSKTAQEAHEAIRPTSVWRTPQALKAYLSRDLLRLYTLIWSRFVASQMAPAEYDTVSADLYAGPAATPILKRPYLFRATGSTLRFPGFLAVYEETAPSDKPDDDKVVVPSDLVADEPIDLLKLFPEQHFTQPPPRFSEATLVKELEENGIGRPSTYASIISTIQQRGYVTVEEKRLVPTETGAIVTDLLVEHFPNVLSVDFTARLEDELDTITEGRPWVPVVDSFYRDFAANLALANEKIPQVNLTKEVEYVGRTCPTCGEGELVYREGRFGRFIGCERFPNCRHTEQIIVTTGVTCPVGGGELIEKRSRKGRVFYGCSRYPECQWTSWSKPVAVAGSQIVVENRQNVRSETACGLGQESAEPAPSTRRGRG